MICSTRNNLRHLDRFFVDHPGIIHLGRSAQFIHQDLDEIFVHAKQVVTTIVNHRLAAHRADWKVGDELPAQL